MRTIKTIGAIAIALLAIGCDNHLEKLNSKIGVGDPAPRSQNKLAEHEDRWREVSTMDTKVRLYRWRIADLIDEGRPFLVVFGTPQHCTMCVDQLVRVAVLEEKYGEEFAFVHVDGYKDTDVWVEWGVKGEPWTFIVGADGIVRSVFPGQTEIALIENEMRELTGG